jgi:putative transcriptional regulator
MRDSIKKAVGTTVNDMLKAGLKTTFTKKELDALGVQIPEISLSPEKIKAIRKKTKLSQSVFSNLLNVSLSSVRQWEQGHRVPTGATKVLLELLDKSPHILDYRIRA